MRRILLAIAATMAILSAAALLPNRAEAMTLPAPAGIGAAIVDTSVTEEAAYVCRRVWNGYRWTRACFWRPGGGYYRPYRRAHRPYRHWRRW
jgi:hypothetical protein